MAQSRWIAAGIVWWMMALCLQHAAGTDFRGACESAQAVVTGTVQVPEVSGVAARLRTRAYLGPTMVVLNADGVIEGDVPLDAPLTVWWFHSLHPGWPPYRGLWFLTRDDSGVWSLMPVVSAQVGIRGAGAAITPREETDRVAGGGTCIERVWAILKLNADHVEKEPQYFDGLDALFSNCQKLAPVVPDFDATVSRLAKHSSPAVRALAVGAGMLQEKTEYLVQAVDQIDELEHSRGSPHIGNALLAWRRSDPVAVAALRRLAFREPRAGHSGDALMVLLSTHTKETAPVFIELLDSTDGQLQDAAIRGLSLFVRESNPALMDEEIRPYVTATTVPAGEIERYVAAWKAWWARRGDGIQSASGSPCRFACLPLA